MSNPSKSSASPPFIVAGIAFISGFILLLLMLTRAEYLTQAGMVNHIWYVLLLFLGLAAAICLFSLFKGYARLTGRVLVGVIELGGPTVVFFAVIIFGFTMAPHPATAFDLVIYLQDKNGNPLRLPKEDTRQLVHTLNLNFGNDPRAATVGQHGEARFFAIPYAQHGKAVAVQLISRLYELISTQHTVTLTSNELGLRVQVQTKQQTGHVQDSKTARPIAGAIIAVADKRQQPLHQTTSDVNGDFNLALPADLPNGIGPASIKANNYCAWTGAAILDSTPLGVLLKPLNPAKPDGGCNEQ